MPCKRISINKKWYSGKQKIRTKRMLVSDCGVVRSAGIRLSVHRRGVFGLVIDGAALVFFRNKFLDLPVVRLDADGEFEVFASNGVPVLFQTVSRVLKETMSGRTNLVDHHDGQ